ncbi:hypothetical protein ACFXKC_56315 [Streptomyces sp. NPDC059340]|uniref:hypothetical protein n=1 Tax=Streptomyces sp. NPDC059340 TaxID=3346806 RepID=UPI0036CD2260
MPRTSRTQRLVMLTASTALAAGGVLLPTSAFAAPSIPHTGAVATAAAHHDGHDGNSDRDSWNGKGKGGDWNGKGKGGDWNGKGKGGGCKGGKGPDPKPGGPGSPTHPTHPTHPKHPTHPTTHPKHPTHPKPKPGGVPIDNGPVLHGIPGE